MSIMDRLFRRPKPQLEPENEYKKADRELKRRLIEEHTTANNAGRARIEAQARASTLRYLEALNGAMNIMGDR
jgi:hypothetical protein